jgi:hypothetical protein
VFPAPLPAPDRCARPPRRKHLDLSVDGLLDSERGARSVLVAEVRKPVASRIIVSMLRVGELRLRIVGDPLLLLEAASSYRGDLEDRLTELFATALSEHDGFCRELLEHIGVRDVLARFDVKTQQSFPDGPARVDLVIRGSDDASTPTAVVFIESKYNPRKLPSSYWFRDDQARQQATALAGEPGEDRHLVAIASDPDLLRRLIPDQYVPRIGWRGIAELANRAGGPDGWQADARRPTASVAQRVLLEFWTYLKGDTVGALEESDLDVLGQIVRAEDRVTALLERAAEELEWDEEVADDWITPGEAPIHYIGGEVPTHSWVAKRRDGSLYALVTGAEWNDESPAGEPQLYAGWGFSAKREERDAIATSPWPTTVTEAGLIALFEPDGIYVFSQRALSEIVERAGTLSAQASLLVSWAQEVVATALALPEPPDLANEPKTRGRRAGSRCTKT